MYICMNRIVVIISTILTTIGIMIMSMSMMNGGARRTGDAGDARPLGARGLYYYYYYYYYYYCYHYYY